jgi:hypothetical protein
MIYGRAQNRPAIESDEDGRYLVHFPAPSSSTRPIEDPAASFRESSTVRKFAIFRYAR